MKKNLIALAVLAASGVASAQSSVTVYGIADVWVGSLKSAGVRQAMVGSGGVDQSRFGFKGTEDLGGGLKANFVLEQGFNIDTGTVVDNSGGTVKGNQAFSRQSYVGLSSALGEVRLGRTLTPFEDISGATTPGFNSALAPSSSVWLSTGHNISPANTVYYASPSFSGFSGAASYSLGEDKNTLAPTFNNKAGRTGSFNVKYEGGPVYAGLAYQAEKLAGAPNSVKFTRVNGSYDLGVVKLLAGYGRVADQGVADARTTEWQIGADYPVTSALTLSGGYARSKDNAVLGNAKRSGLGLVASYSLSKRTSVYGGVQANKTEAATTTKGDLYAVGIRHTF